MQDQPSFSPRSAQKLLGTAAAGAPFATSNLMAQASSETVRHASFGADGMAWADLTQIANCDKVEIAAICEVELLVICF